MALSARRLRLPFALLIALIVGAIIYNRTREDRWRPLPGGGEIRCIAVTHEGPGNVLFKTKPSILEPLRSHLGPRWSHLVGPAPMEARGSMSGPIVVVWFQIRNDPSGQRHNTTTIELDTPFHLVRGDNLDDWHMTIINAKQEPNLVGVIFADDCRNEPRLHIRYSPPAGTVDFDIANPLLYDAPRGPGR